VPAAGQVFSFKLRGAFNKMASLSPEQRARGVITSSAGNHAQGVSLAAAKLARAHTPACAGCMHVLPCLMAWSWGWPACMLFPVCPVRSSPGTASKEDIDCQASVLPCDACFCMHSCMHVHRFS
jgi:hypothetical protein